jgi:NitT/TauT family transport system substrate-binding protein
MPRRAGWGRDCLRPALVTLALVSVGGCGTSGGAATKAATANSANTTLKVAYVPATTALALEVAKAQGYFARNKLNVTLQQAANISTIPVALGRQFDISLGTATDLIRAGSAGLGVVEIAGNTVDTKANPFAQLIVRPHSGIRRVKDLQGKKVGTPTLSGVLHVAVLYWAKKEGADPSKIQGVQAPSPVLPDLLKAKRVDAVEALEPFATTLKAKGSTSLGDPFAAIAQPLATNFWIAQRSWARAHQDVVRRFVRALEEAAAYIAQNPAQARRILQRYTSMPAPIAARVPLPRWDFAIRTGDLVKWVTALKAIGQFKGQVDPSRLVVTGGT